MPGACSQASNIALREAGLTFELVKVDRHTKKAADGLDFNDVNPKGYVPALTLDSGETLTENICVLQYIADRNPAAKLAPAYGTMERYRLIEWLGLHQLRGAQELLAAVPRRTPPRRRGSSPSATSPSASTTCSSRLAGRDYLTATQFTVADCYLGVVLSWSRPREARSGQMARA